MAGLKPCYLVCGEDDAKIDAWRARVRSRAEAELGPGGLEPFNARSAAPDEVVASMAALTFATGTRYLLVEDAGAWKAGELGPLTAALGAMPPDTVLVLVVRGKPLAALAKAVEAAGGEVRNHPAPKPWELPRWVAGRAREEGLSLDAEAAQALVDAAGPSQQRLSREIEKIAIAVHPERSASAEDVSELAAGSTAPKLYDLADAVVAGDRRAALRLARELEAADERPGRLVYPVVTRLREVLRIVALLEAGVAEGELSKHTGGPPWRVKKSVPLARRADRAALERALCRFADLELDLRGGGSPLDENTALTLTIARAA